jgi:hypothetical protein
MELTTNPFQHYLVKFLIERPDLTIYSWESVTSKDKKFLFLIKDNNLLVSQKEIIYHYSFEKPINITTLNNLNHELLYYRNTDIQRNNGERWDDNVAKYTLLYYYDRLLNKMPELQQATFLSLWNAKHNIMTNSLITFNSWDIYLHRNKKFFMEYFGFSVFTILQHAGYAIYLKSIVHMSAIKLIYNQIMIQI